MALPETHGIVETAGDGGAPADGRPQPRRSPDNLVGLSSRLVEVRAHALIADVIEREFAGRVALVSSFGAESAILLHLVSRVDKTTPVIFIDTGRLFAHTLAYRQKLVEHLGLADIRTAAPDDVLLAHEDADRTLWQSDPDRCCAIRKVAPLADALQDFDAWITGRKRFHGGDRSGLPLVEAAAQKVKINPLADWSRDDVTAYFKRHGLPQHPLVADGFLSIGCEPCTARAPAAETAETAGDNPRQGRWPDLSKTECGIHFSPQPNGSNGSGM